MKKKTFFYRFNKDRDKYQASNHSFISDDEDENESFNKINSLLEKQVSIIDTINNAEAKFKTYYEKRLDDKLKLISKNDRLNNIIPQKYLSEIKYYVISFSFWKIISYRDIESFSELLWSDIFSVSWYDTVIDFIVDKKINVFERLRDLINNESIKLNTFLANQEYWNSDKFLFAIENVVIDSSNRPHLLNFNYEWNHKNTLVKINKNSFSKEDMSLLKEIYLLFKTEASNVNIEDIEDDGSSYLLFLFRNVENDFFKYITWIFDQIVSVEIIDTYTTYVTGSESINIEIPTISLENIKHNICIVDSKVVNTNPLLQDLVKYGTSYEKTDDSHWTNVATLSCFWRVENNVLNNPKGYIYNIETEQSTFSEIKNIINEALQNNCKIINISQWVVCNYLKDNEWISDLAKTIDSELANKDVLLVLSGWNINPPKSRHSDLSNEDSNINIPKDSISSISIGAKDNNANPALYSRKSNVVPSYNIWKNQARLNRVKDKKSPAFIEYWDNIVFNWNIWYEWLWTSFAAPLLCHKALQILNEFDYISTNTIKALFINYSNLSRFNKSIYGNDNDLMHRHLWWGEIDLNSIIGEDNKNVNIIIEDYISQNESKKYSIILPKIDNNSSVIVKTSISYNPPISRTFHLKYAKFNVSAKLWSQTYQDAKDSFFKSWEQGWMSKWKEWKDQRGTINWVNYFWNDQMWSPNSIRVNEYNYNLYEELRNNTEIIIEWHTRNNFKYTQKFSFVMTIDISSLVNPEEYITNLQSMNQQILISWEQKIEIKDNILAKEKEFESETDVSISIEDIEGF